MNEKMTWLPTWRHFFEAEFLEVKFLRQPQSLGQETWPSENSSLNRILSKHVLFQYFKVIFEDLGLVFKHFYMLQHIVSCSILMTCLTLTRGWLYFPKTSSNLPYKYKEQSWKNIYFLQFPTKGSCSILLIPKRPKSLHGTIRSLGKLWCQFSLWFFKTFFEDGEMY
jgi:hypothetical protein